VGIEELRQRLSRLTGKPLSTGRELVNAAVPSTSGRASGERLAPHPKDPEVSRPGGIGREFSSESLKGRTELVEAGGSGCLCVKTVYPSDLVHGRLPVSRLDWLTPEVVSTLASCSGPVVFLDTETTGLSGGAGTFAFLVGLGEVSDGAFIVTQYLMRDLPDEPAVLQSVTRFLETHPVLVTFNGRSFDWPLLLGRYRLNGLAPAVPPAHFDALPLSRRLFRQALGSVRLIRLEEALLGYWRHDDLESALIPEAYFRYYADHRIMRSSR